MQWGWRTCEFSLTHSPDKTLGNEVEVTTRSEDDVLVNPDDAVPDVLVGVSAEEQGQQVV